MNVISLPCLSLQLVVQSLVVYIICCFILPVIIIYTNHTIDALLLLLIYPGQYLSILGNLYFIIVNVFEAII